MKLSETGMLLTVAASFDKRTLGEADAEAWHKILGAYTYADCEAAVIGHYTDSNDWLMPAHVVRRVKAAREGRLREYGTLEPPRDLSVAEEQRWRREALQRVADGVTPRKAIEG